MMRLGQQTAIVTGAAQGIGKGVALALAEAGANIIIGDINPDKATLVAQEIRALGREVLVVPLDVRDEAHIDQAISLALTQFPEIHILVNNAGVMQSGLGEQTSTADFERCYGVNLQSIWLMTQALLPHFKAQGQGKIINIASAAGRRGIGNFPAYCASKSAAISLTQSLSQSLAPFNINVNALCPGLVWTPMWEKLEDMIGSTDEASHKPFEQGVQQTPLGRAITPEDVGHAAVFFAADEAKNITGQALNIDGGSVLN